MPTCRSCGRRAPVGAAFCPGCGARVGADDVAVGATGHTGVGRPSSSRSPYEGSFAPGTLLAGRYRIVALVGEGGMGEVYLADDLTLEQPVALKFLPEGIVHSEETLARFRAEVRLARQVTHPNVARVHDIGEVEGRPFLSMEFVDGEDLATLLHRIGRLPREKGIEIARQICAGLAEAHGKRVLHRDLKPANVMLDGDGRVKITDFGLAVIASDQDGGPMIAGTPAYMAPEQIAGREVTVQSEIYSLGLVLYEVFTGKRAFDGRTVEELRRQHESETPRSPSSVVEGLDPAIERVLMRCLEKEPSRRPPSARAVALALPGGDPLAAALAAGETPSPELVAQAGAEGGLRPALAWSLLSVVVVGLVAVVLLSKRTGVVQGTELPKPPAVLAERAREVLALAGHDAAVADALGGFAPVPGYARHLAGSGEQPPGGRLASPPGPILYWYRTSPRYLVPAQWDTGLVDREDPAFTLPGMARVELDPRGRLTSLELLPAERDAEGASRPAFQGAAWDPLFAAAGLARAGFAEVAPQWTPRVATDERAAWVGSYPELGEAELGEEVRVEAGAFRGRPVSFRVVWPWTRPVLEPDASGDGAMDVAALVAGLAMLILGLGGGLIVALRNLRQGRGDRRGAARVATAMLVAGMASWLFLGHHAPTGAEVGVFFLWLSYSLATFCLMWVFYVAIEPYLRRLWPHTLVSWVRLLDGRLRDPLVGRDVLVGAVAGIALVLLALLIELASAWAGSPPVYREEVLAWRLSHLQGLRATTGLLFAGLQTGPMFGAALFAVLVILRLLVRRPWLAMLLLYAFVVLSGPGPADLVTTWILRGLTAALFLLVMLRFGLLPFAVAFFLLNLLDNAPLTPDLEAWYSGSTLLAGFVVLALAGYGFYVSLAGRPMFRDELAA